MIKKDTLNDIDDIDIIEPTKKAMEKYIEVCGTHTVWIKKEHTQALSDGKMITFSNGEYSFFILLEKQ